MLVNQTINLLVSNVELGIHFRAKGSCIKHLTISKSKIIHNRCDSQSVGQKKLTAESVCGEVDPSWANVGKRLTGRLEDHFDH